MEAEEISSFLTLVSLLMGGLAFIYSEVKAFRLDVKTDFSEVRQNRKAELEQVKIELMTNLLEVKSQVQALLSQSKVDLKTDINELKRDARDDMAQMRSEILRLTQQVAALNSILSFLKKDDDKSF